MDYASHNPYGDRPRSYDGYENYMPPSRPPPGAMMNAPTGVNHSGWAPPQYQSQHLNPWQQGQSQAPQRPQSMSSYSNNPNQNQYQHRPPSNQQGYGHPPPPPGPPPSTAGQYQSIPFHRPQIGFTALPHRFHIWNFMKGSTSYLQVGAELFGPVAYSCKLRGSAKLEVTAGSAEQPVIASANSKSTFSSKSWLMFENHKVLLIPENNYKTYYLDVPVPGNRLEKCEWRKMGSSGLLGKLLGAGSGAAPQPRGWELVTAGAPAGTAAAEPLVRMVYQGGSMMEKNSHLYTFEWQGRALRGGMGDVFTAVVIVSALQIMHTEYITKIAKSVGAAAG
ncbi:unnamed protein product [Clonostachys rhizophaga]|uniref:Uncharacterized protein n=1 Tax=Clonostachys rhizophaga TaxID=160324 RepID=A0A9N9YNS2_9HYPO|nr:unnamed protein product [Clonostachys rhizophaga]